MKFNEAVKILLKFDFVIESVKETYGDVISEQILKDLDENCLELGNYSGLKEFIYSLIFDNSCEIYSYQGKWDYYTTIKLLQFMNYNFYFVKYDDLEVEDFYLTEKEGFEEYEDLIEYKESCEEDLNEEE